MEKRNIIIVSVALVVVLMLAAGGGIWFMSQQEKKLEMATQMMCTTFALQMTQVHKQRAMLMEAIGNLKDKAAAEGDKEGAEATPPDSEKFLFSEGVDKKIDEFVATLDGKYDEGRPMKQQSPEVMQAFADMATVLQNETGSYWSECLSEMRPAVEQCSAFQDNEAEMAECMKSQGGKIRELMGKYLKLDLNS